MNDTSRSLRSTTTWVAAVTTVTAATALGLAVTTPPRSGPLCQEGCIGYPYVDAAPYVPRDFLWMYPTVLLLLSALALVHPGHRLPRRLPSALTTVGTGILLAAYGIQLGYVQPALLSGETDGLAAWSPYNPHGVFVALENAGYAVLAIGLAAAGLPLSRAAAGLERAAGAVLLGSGGLTVVLTVALPALYRWQLEYRFEVAAIALVLFALVAAPVLLVAGAVEPLGDRGGRAAAPRSRERMGT